MGPTASPTNVAVRRLRAAAVPVSDAQVDRAAYSSDASLYRVVPMAVAFPRSTAELRACVDIARQEGVSLTARGAGTSIAGNAVGPGLVVDLRRYLHRVLAVDTERGSVRVQPGISLGDLQRTLTPTGWRVGPDPSSGSRATVGGMIGNNACGPRSLAYGRTSDAVTDLLLITGSGETDSTRDGFAGLRAALAQVADEHLAELRTELGRFPRQLSGYALHEMLPERGRDLTRAVVGSEGTWGVVAEATLRLVRSPPHRRLVALGFADIVEAAAAVPEVLAAGPTACEGLDARIVQAVRDRRGPGAVPELPTGQAWLLVEFAGDDPGEPTERAARLGSARALTDPAAAAAIWRIREDGAGLSGRAPSGRPAWPGWEDAAVPPAALAGYLRDFDDLVTEHWLTTMPYGHFGEGCVHARIDFPLDRPDGGGQLRRFLLDAADLVARHGGSLSGEHGDGRARGELLGRLFSPALLDAFARARRVVDPDGVLNPDVLAAPVDADLRRPAARPRSLALGWRYPADGGDLTAAVHRCTGVGRCVVTHGDPGAVMCPSYAATRAEKDSTRGRARVLQELTNGTLVADWRSPAVRDALDLCLSCKGCLRDCPTGVDVATWKSEALHQAYRGRWRPPSHYLLGRLPTWLRWGAWAPGPVNRLLGSRPGRLALAAAGLEADRRLPELAPERFRTWFARRPARAGRPVTLFVDTFTDHLSPQVGRAAVAVLEAAGYAPVVPGPRLCCGLTLISTGQLDRARAVLGRTLQVLRRSPGPIVGLEPSCTAVLRHDAGQLDAGAADVAARTRTLAELLTDTDGWRPPDLSGIDAVAQPHCHQHAVMGWETDAALLAAAGARVQRLGGCCGLAGNFGLEKGHGEVSRAVAGLQLLPALAAAPDWPVLADGFSCRTQVADLTGRRAHHLAELLAGWPEEPGQAGRREPEAYRSRSRARVASIPRALRAGKPSNDTPRDRPR